MTVWVLTKPRWLVCGVLGVLCAGLFVVFGRLNTYGWIESVIVGLVGGALFGLAMAYLTKSSLGRLLASAGQLSKDRQIAAVQLAVGRGTVDPDQDARVLRGASQVAHYRREENQRQQTATVAVLGILLLLSTGMALLNSPWWLAGTALFAVLIVASLDRPRRLRIRDEALQNAVQQLRPAKAKPTKRRR